MTATTPQRLIDRGAGELRRFGYVPQRDDEPDWSAMWQLLKGDFATAARLQVPDFDRLGPWPQQAARIYMRRRLLADRLFEDCTVLYDRIHSQGIGTDLVEAYTLARDAYEDAVMEFGDAREKLEQVLAQALDNVRARP